MSSFLYGLEHASHDFREPDSLGKNIFTNAFPLSLAQYLATERDLPLPTIKATVEDGRLSTVHEMTSWSDLLGVTPGKAHFDFEAVYNGYQAYTHSNANKSDVVVSHSDTGEQLRPFEIKLVVVPTSSTANKRREDQSCEIVVRPSTVEQLAFSIAHSFGPTRRSELQSMIVNALEHPSDFQWANESYMLDALPRVLQAAENIVRGGLQIQTPLVLTAIWRTEGQRPLLEEHAFDVFAWTDMAFLQLFINQLRNEFFTADGTRRANPRTSISRPSRGLIWLIRSLLDYCIQNSLNFGAIHSKVTYGVQSDKAGAFAGESTLRHLRSPEFLRPRVTRSELSNVLHPRSAQFLMPERRLDAAIAIQHLAEELASEANNQSGQG